MSHHTLAFLLIFLGGGLGSMLRHTVNQASAALFGINFAWGTLFVNIAGSLAMGLLAGWFAFRAEGGQLLQLFLATGVLGGFTTFSAFSLEAVLLWERGQAAAAVLYTAGSVTVAIIGVLAGLFIIRTWLT
ncbi:MAG: fluoride efflux transporter CrcB [Bryobacteraceae bacterium]